MPRCYLLALASSSALDTQSNNVSLFHLVEQVNLPSASPPPPHGILPLEVHAYFSLSTMELGQPFEVRHVLRSSAGLESYSETFSHQAVTPRFRTRTLGVPFPAVVGQYVLHLDWRPAGAEEWHREPLGWPLLVAEIAPRPSVVH